MMKQWHAVKARHKDGLLFFRMGDFFEFFHEDAKKAARLLGLTLTARSKGEDAIPMAGIPAKTAEAYIRKLVDLGEKVIVCDQVEDPAQATGLVERDVTRIVTPGTITEEDSLDARANNYLVAVAGDHLAYVDLSTGDFALRLTGGQAVVEAVAALEPAEVLVPESAMAADGLGAALVTQGLRVSERPDWCFDHDAARRLLNRQFRTRSLEGFGIDEEEQPLGAAGAILEYLEETQRGAVGQLRRIRCENAAGHMRLDRTTRSSLELVRSLRDGERRGSLLGVMDRCKTAMGARLLKRLILEPLLDRDEIVARQDAVAHLVAEPELLDRIRSAAEDVLDLERLAGRVGCGRAHPRDLAALRQSLRQAPALTEPLEASGVALLDRILAAMPDLGDLADLLERALVDAPPLTVTEGGIIRPGHDAELDEIRALRRDGKEFIASFQAREIAATGIANLKIGFNRVFGYYIEITNSQREKIPERYLRKQTLKNAERYITPELKDYEDKVLHAEERMKSRETELFQALRDAAEARLDDLQRLADGIAWIDVLQSLARLAVDGGWVRPEIVTEDVLQIEEGCHPVLIRSQRDEPFVPNDVDLDRDHRLMLITGPNMAGKSTYIRQVALLTLISQIGSFIPARRARIGLVDRIFTRVGASDDLARGSSTFMVEMLEVANILNNAGPRSLVILDEVGRGTSTYDGLSLAWAITERLVEGAGVKTLFATHYHELTAMTEHSARIVNFNVAVREWGDEIIFLHKIVAGATDRSYGIHVAQLAGLPAAVIERARAILDRLEEKGEEGPVPAPVEVEGQQLGLFSAEPDPLRLEIARLDLDSMAPIEALNLLHAWQGRERRCASRWLA
ncbi:MAG: DNA mismatch repair protein MutS [Planctomycetes bacterium]|nr:DNA mismatch repair protein MutS [Planctomycetota bacterium]